MPSDARGYGARDDTAFFKKLKQAIDGAPRDLAKRPDVSNYKDDGYLGRLTDGAFALLADDEDSQAIAPHFSAPTLTAEDGRAELGCVLDGFFDRAARWHGADRECRCDPEHAAIAVDLGLGKSRFARVRLGYFIEHAKTEGRPHRILWMVPIHRLGNESAADMRDLGLHVAVLRGRDAADPSAPGLTMCVNLTAVADAQAIGESVETALCGTLAGACCPFHATCAYQAQKPRAVAADVVILANQGLFNAMNKTMRANLALTIIDEAFWQTGLAHYTIRLPGFAAEPTTWPVLRDANAQREGFTMDGVRMSRRRRRKAGDLPPRWLRTRTRRPNCTIFAGRPRRRSKRSRTKGC
ncbi:MAG TPA: hypothetical protein VKI44_34160 [Acetobacteraceae bacterium]|nr:hypothetical protein [Acetobacteraceae bacterium]